MAEELAGKVAIITGGANGLGRATAERFVAEGAKVVIADMDTARGEELAGQLGNSARFRTVDVADCTQVQALVDYAVSEFGGLHVMFNNAGIGGTTHRRFLDDDLADFHRVVDVNLLGVMVGTQYAARHMAKHGGGSIINTASIAGTIAGFGVVTYRSAKAAVVHFSKSAAIDLAEYNIRVNCLTPGHIPTDINSFAPPGLGPEKTERMLKELIPVWAASRPLKRVGNPEDVAHAVVYLASDKAAQVTGIVMPVDGGVSAGDAVNHLQNILDVRNRMMED